MDISSSIPSHSKPRSPEPVTKSHPNAGVFQTLIAELGTQPTASHVVPSAGFGIEVPDAGGKVLPHAAIIGPASNQKVTRAPLPLVGQIMDVSLPIEATPALPSSTIEMAQPNSTRTKNQPRGPTERPIQSTRALAVSPSLPATLGASSLIDGPNSLDAETMEVRTQDQSSAPDFLSAQSSLSPSLLATIPLLPQAAGSERTERKEGVGQSSRKVPIAVRTRLSSLEGAGLASRAAQSLLLAQVTILAQGNLQERPTTTPPHPLAEEKNKTPPPNLGGGPAPMGKLNSVVVSSGGVTFLHAIARDDAAVQIKSEGFLPEILTTSNASHLTGTVAAPASSPAAAQTFDSANQIRLLVDELANAKAMLAPRSGNLSLLHDDFGLVSLRFEAMPHELSVHIAGEDPGLERAIAAAAHQEARTSLAEPTETRGNQAEQNGQMRDPQERSGQRRDSAQAARDRANRPDIDRPTDEYRNNPQNSSVLYA